MRQWGRNQSVHALCRLGRAREALPLVRALAESHKAEHVGEAEKIFDLGGFALTHLALGEMEQAHQRAVQVLEMIRRQPELAKWRNGQPPGPTNALGARALYLFNRGGDSGYRLHGTPEWNSIGKAMSSGCIRLLNQDIIDLHDRASVGAKVIVI